jgi:signal transduction histidine kinase
MRLSATVARPDSCMASAASGRGQMFDDQGFKHLGGGRKGVFLLLRYVFIIAASYLLIFESEGGLTDPTHALMIAIALTSNVMISFMKPSVMFAWYVEAPILIADTLWVAWALNSTGTDGQEFFLLYFFVLSLAALGENLLMVLLGSTVVSAANVYLSADAGWTSGQLLRIAFFYAVALFYGHVLSQIRHQRQRADKGFAWARELELKVEERTVELRRLYDEARAASRLKSEFVATMSHELRTPLHIIMGYVELMLDQDAVIAEDERQRMLRRILESAQSQSHLVQSVLDLGRLESGTMPVEPEPVLLERFIRTLVRKPWTPALPGVELNWSIPPALPLIETDAAKLGVVLDQLISNALKFTAAGRVEVSIDDFPERREVVFHIDDTGPGIASDDLPAIFDAFRQVDASLTREHGGSGLGLALVKHYVVLLGGHIDVESHVGVGTRFTVTLPYRARHSAAGAHGDAERESASDDTAHAA